MEQSIYEKINEAGGCKEAFEKFVKENPIPEFLWVTFLWQAMEQKHQEPDPGR